ncbi:MAG: DUF3124 domain-containing protein [Flavobacteriaceae bacterium]|nr:DUF3124 domain-containing protein [Flavobacteriaceae bacterium]
MKYYYKLLGITMLVISLTACEKQNPNLNKTGNDELESLELDHKINQNLMQYADIIYIPIYSDIYINAQNPNSLLSATLSIRNTSTSDSLFVSTIDYFNTAGTLVRNYLNNPISLPPMGTVNYVVEKDDTAGGSGANFIVTLSAKHNGVKPLIQAIMIGENGNNQGFAFSTDGYSIKSNTTNN